VAAAAVVAGSQWRRRRLQLQGHSVIGGKRAARMVSAKFCLPKLQKLLELKADGHLLQWLEPNNQPELVNSNF
jgi:hypothetical protein